MANLSDDEFYKLLQEFKHKLRGTLIHGGEQGTAIESAVKDYKSDWNSPFPVEELGFEDAYQLLEYIDDTVQLKYIGGKWNAVIVPDANTKHVSDLVNATSAKKKQRPKGKSKNRSGPGRGSGSSGGQFRGSGRNSAAGFYNAIGSGYSNSNRATSSSGYNFDQCFNPNQRQSQSYRSGNSGYGYGSEVFGNRFQQDKGYGGRGQSQNQKSWNNGSYNSGFNNTRPQSRSAGGSGYGYNNMNPTDVSSTRDPESEYRSGNNGPEYRGNNGPEYRSGNSGYRSESGGNRFQQDKSYGGRGQSQMAWNSGYYDNSSNNTRPQSSAGLNRSNNMNPPVKATYGPTSSYLAGNISAATEDPEYRSGYGIEAGDNRFQQDKSYSGTGQNQKAWSNGSYDNSSNNTRPQSSAGLNDNGYNNMNPPEVSATTVDPEYQSSENISGPEYRSGNSGYESEVIGNRFEQDKSYGDGGRGRSEKAWNNGSYSYDSGSRCNNTRPQSSAGLGGCENMNRASNPQQPPKTSSPEPVPEPPVKVTYCPASYISASTVDPEDGKLILTRESFVALIQQHGPLTISKLKETFSQTYGIPLNVALLNSILGTKYRSVQVAIKTALFDDIEIDGDGFLTAVGEANKGPATSTDIPPCGPAPSTPSASPGPFGSSDSSEKTGDALNFSESFIPFKSCSPCDDATAYPSKSTSPTDNQADEMPGIPFKICSPTPGDNAQEEFDGLPFKECSTAAPGAGDSLPFEFSQHLNIAEDDDDQEKLRQFLDRAYDFVCGIPDRYIDFEELRRAFEDEPALQRTLCSTILRGIEGARDRFKVIYIGEYTVVTVIP